jgi:membrane protein
MRRQVEWVKERYARFKDTRPGRAIGRYSDERGNVLAGGIAYHGLISLAAGVVVLSTTAAVLVGSRPGWRDAVLRFLDRTVPGSVGEGSDGLISTTSLSSGAVTGLVGALALLLSLNRATRYVSALRAATQTMLGTESRSPLRSKAADLTALASLLGLALVAAGLQVAAGSASAWLGADGKVHRWLVLVVAVAVGLAVDATFVSLVFVLLGGAGRPYRRLLPVALAVAAAIGVLRAGSAVLLGTAVSNPVLAPFAAVVTVLVWVDVLARLVLLGAAWVGTGNRTNGVLD